ncbi:hypothetical protein C8J56DRAFT_1045316 [Mycena floridula]|nr:hypothetical protein C8J56DRAFT_1045316 [Mycena floridula]
MPKRTKQEIYHHVEKLAAVNMARGLKPDHDVASAIQEMYSDDATWDTREIIAKAEKLCKENRDLDAISIFKKAAALLVGDDFLDKMPVAGQTGKYRCEKYFGLSVLAQIRLAAICALTWFREVFVVQMNMRISFNKDQPLFEWTNRNPVVDENFLNMSLTQFNLSKIFLGLLNSSCGVHYKWTYNTLVLCRPTTIDEALLRFGPNKHESDTKDLYEHWKLQHPEPTMMEKATVTDSSRNALASFFYNGCVYVLGGQQKINFSTLELNFLCDLWCVSVTADKPRWRQLPSVKYAMLGHEAVVYKHKAYVFTGSPNLPCFDLISEKWSTVKTYGGVTYPRPQRLGSSQNMGMIMVNGKMYLFGGTTDASNLGSDIFQSLDMETFKWETLSGSLASLDPDWDTPGPRQYPLMWSNKDGSVIHIMFGDANREAAKMYNERGAEMLGYPYEDFWSYDIASRKWNREVILGNPPCPRTEMAVTYNPVIDKTLFFGGYSCCLNTFYEDQSKNFEFAYFADTYILDSRETPDSPPPHFRQVITRGFPTYRAQSRLLSDPITGQTYMFGGYTNTKYVPGRRDYISRCYLDVWRLKLDMEGGGFEDVDWQDEANTRAGPWECCFSCGTTGYRLKKCGGSCNGRIFFCDSGCLKDGWQEHKEKHKCRKV